MSGQGHGGISLQAYAPSLAQAYHLKAGYNAFEGKEALLYRAAAAALRDLMAITE